MEEETGRKLTEEELDVGMRIYGERIENIEKVLRLNIQHPTETEKCEQKIAALKNKKGVFHRLYRKYLEHKLKRSANVPPKKLNSHSRKVLEKKLEKYKKIVADFYKIKSFRNYEVK